MEKREAAEGKKRKIWAGVLSQERLAEGVFDLWLQADEIVREAGPGQFVSVYTKDASRLLPRPVSICQIDRERGRLRLVYRVAGAGTKEFSRCKAGDSLSVMGPLGNGFFAGDTSDKKKKAILIGGGIGIPPMLGLAQELEGERQIVLGYRDGQLFLKQDFASYGKVYVATEDGSAGIKGNVIDAIKAHGLTAEAIYACGPTPMLRAVKAYAREQGVECWLSLEERMACGVGACLACVCQSKNIDPHSHVHNKRICKDGPVFQAQEVEL